MKEGESSKSSGSFAGVDTLKLYDENSINNLLSTTDNPNPGYKPYSSQIDNSGLTQDNIKTIAQRVKKDKNVADNKKVIFAYPANLERAIETPQERAEGKSGGLAGLVETDPNNISAAPIPIITQSGDSPPASKEDIQAHIARLYTYVAQGHLVVIPKDKSDNGQERYAFGGGIAKSFMSSPQYHLVQNALGVFEKFSQDYANAGNDEQRKKLVESLSPSNKAAFNLGLENPEQDYLRVPLEKSSIPSPNPPAPEDNTKPKSDPSDKKPESPLLEKSSASNTGEKPAVINDDLFEKIKQMLNKHHPGQYTVDKDETNILIHKKDGSPVPGFKLNAERIDVMGKGKRLDNESCKAMLRTAVLAFNQPLILYSPDEKERKLMEDVALDMGIKYTMTSTQEDYDRLRRKAGADNKSNAKDTLEIKSKDDKTPEKNPEPKPAIIPVPKPIEKKKEEEEKKEGEMKRYEDKIDDMTKDLENESKQKDILKEIAEGKSEIFKTTEGIDGRVNIELNKPDLCAAGNQEKLFFNLNKALNNVIGGESQDDKATWSQNNNGHYCASISQNSWNTLTNTGQNLKK